MIFRPDERLNSFKYEGCKSRCKLAGETRQATLLPRFPLIDRLEFNHSNCPINYLDFYSVCNASKNVQSGSYEGTVVPLTLPVCLIPSRRRDHCPTSLDERHKESQFTRKDMHDGRRRRRRRHVAAHEWSSAGGNFSLCLPLFLFQTLSSRFRNLSKNISLSRKLRAGRGRIHDDDDGDDDQAKYTHTFRVAHVYTYIYLSIYLSIFIYISLYASQWNSRFFFFLSRSFSSSILVKLTDSR